jgi:hypothetical protein
MEQKAKEPVWVRFGQGQVHSVDPVVRKCVATFNAEVEKKICSIDFISSSDVIKLIRLGWESKELAELPSPLVKSLSANNMKAEEYRKLIFPEPEIEVVYDKENIR